MIRLTKYVYVCKFRFIPCTHVTFISMCIYVYWATNGITHVSKGKPNLYDGFWYTLCNLAFSPVHLCVVWLKLYTCVSACGFFLYLYWSLDGSVTHLDHSSLYCFWIIWWQGVRGFIGYSLYWHSSVRALSLLTGKRYCERHDSFGFHDGTCLYSKQNLSWHDVWRIDTWTFGIYRSVGSPFRG